MTAEEIENASSPIKLCECGCGGTIKTPSCNFVPGHSNKGARRKGKIVQCSWCTKDIWVQESRLKSGRYVHGRFYCDRRCKSQYLKGCLSGDNNPNWKGGRIFYKGRPAVRVPNHPRASREGYVYEHLIVVENAIGRPLKFIRHADPDNEVVHHIDKDKTNNRRENLLVCTSRYHNWLHWQLRKQKKAGGVLF
ncbi:MAG: HNH endonuclease [Deltaproteobacteria bacterium]|nr:HNH endonuclease [Deltaproteobacteria bacterium]